MTPLLWRYVSAPALLSTCLGRERLRGGSPHRQDEMGRDRRSYRAKNAPPHNPRHGVTIGRGALSIKLMYQYFFRQSEVPTALRTARKNVRKRRIYDVVRVRTQWQHSRLAALGWSANFSSLIRENDYVRRIFVGRTFGRSIRRQRNSSLP